MAGSVSPASCVRKLVRAHRCHSPCPQILSLTARARPAHDETVLLRCQRRRSLAALCAWVRLRRTRCGAFVQARAGAPVWGERCRFVHTPLTTSSAGPDARKTALCLVAAQVHRATQNPPPYRPPGHGAHEVVVLRPGESHPRARSRQLGRGCIIHAQPSPGRRPRSARVSRAHLTARRGSAAVRY